MSRTEVAILGAVFVSFLPFQRLQAGEPGTSGFLFLRLGGGARAAGMGEAFTAICDDASSMYYNAGGMASVSGVELEFTHTEWIQDIRFEQITVLNEMFGGTAGVSFTGLYYGEMDRYGDYPSIVPDGTFAPYDMAISAGYAMDFLPNLSAGVVAKVIYEKIDFESCTGWAIDAGFVHKSAIEGLTMAAAIQNLGPQAKFVDDTFYPPFVIRGGVSYSADFARLKGQGTVAADALFPNDGEAKLHLGLEYRYGSILSIRAGYKGNYYSQGITLGLGLALGSFEVDYAYLPIDFNLGDCHRFSIRLASQGR